MLGMLWAVSGVWKSGQFLKGCVIAPLDSWAAAVVVFWKIEPTVSSSPTWSEAEQWEEAHLSPNLSRQHETGIFLMMSLSWKPLKAHCEGGSLVGLNSPWASPNGPSFDETNSLSKAGKNMLDVVYHWDHPGGSSSCLRILVKTERGGDGKGENACFEVSILKVTCFLSLLCFWKPLENTSTQGLYSAGSGSDPETEVASGGTLFTFEPFFKPWFPCFSWHWSG